MFCTFLNPSHSIGTAAASFTGGMFGVGVGKSVKKLDKPDYSYIMIGKQQAASSKQQAASSKQQAASSKQGCMLKLKVFIL
jgi:hypothetical protein